MFQTRLADVTGLEDDAYVGKVLESLTSRRWRPTESCYPEGLTLCRRFIDGDRMRFGRLLQEQLTTTDLASTASDASRSRTVTAACPTPSLVTVPGFDERGGSSLCDVPSAPVEAYVAAFVARCEVMQRTEQAKIDRPGLDGFVSCSDERQVENRLLVIDDRAFDAVVELLSDARAGSIRVFQQAARCAQLLNQHPAWKPEVSTAMVCATCTPCPAPGCQTS